MMCGLSYSFAFILTHEIPVKNEIIAVIAKIMQADYSQHFIIVI